MEPIYSITSKKVNAWNNDYISPGGVGAVGDVLQNVRLKQSAPDLPMRWALDDDQLVDRGMNVQDGLQPSYDTGGLGAITIPVDFYNSPFENRQVGMTYHDIRTNALSMDSRLVPRPQDGWKTQSATTLNGRVTGESFLPLPGGYVPSGVPRGTGPFHQFVSTPDYNSKIDETVTPAQPPEAPVKEEASCPMLGQSRSTKVR